MTCQGVEPLATAGSTTAGEIPAMPSAVILMATGAAWMWPAMMAGEAGSLRRVQGRAQVDEGG